MLLKTIKLFVISFLIFIFLDLFWLGFLGKPIYHFYLQDFLRPSPLWTAAITFYFFFIIGLIIFVINPAVSKKDYRYAFIMGSCYGFITYMTYELTNLAVIDGWPFGIVLIDIAWGTFLCAFISLFTTILYLKFFSS